MYLISNHFQENNLLILKGNQQLETGSSRMSEVMEDLSDFDRAETQLSN